MWRKLAVASLLLVLAGCRVQGAHSEAVIVRPIPQGSEKVKIHTEASVEIEFLPADHEPEQEKP